MLFRSPDEYLVGYVDEGCWEQSGAGLLYYARVDADGYEFMYGVSPHDNELTYNCGNNALYDFFKNDRFYYFTGRWNEFYEPLVEATERLSDALEKGSIEFCVKMVISYLNEYYPELDTELLLEELFVA